MPKSRSQSPRSTRKRTRSLPLLSVLPFLALGWTVGCGDDDDGDPVAQAGKGGAAGSGTAGKSSAGSSGKGTSGSGGGSGEGGESSGGTAGKGASGSGGGSGEGGEGATGPGTSGGAGGEGGSDGGTSGSSASGGTGAGGSGASGGTGGTAGGGSGGTGGGDTFAPITKASDIVVDGVHDLRGLVFARSGKFYAAGHFGADDPTLVETAVDREIAIVRFNDNGSLDTDFGTQGVVRYNLVQREVDSTPAIVNSGDEQALGIVELGSGDFLVQVNLRDAAGTGNDVALLKVDANGALVTGFGTNGLKRVDFGWVDETDHGSWPTAGTTPADQGWGLQLDSSEVGTEKVVVFGFGPAKVGSMTTGTSPVQRTDNDRYVTRLLTSDGSRDPDFNTTGAPYTLNSGGTFGDNGRRGLVLEDGTIYASGYTNFGAGLENHLMIIKLTPAGVPDPEFRYDIALPGVSRSNGFRGDGGAAECYQVGLLSDGNLVTTGYGRATAASVGSSLGWETTQSVDLVGFALLPNGAPDLDWGVSGTLAIQSEALGRPDTEERGRDLVVLPDDRVVHAGRFGGNPALFVVKANGELDTSSGVDGRFEYDPLTASTSHFYAVAKSSDSSKIIATTNNSAAGVRVALLSVAAE